MHSFTEVVFSSKEIFKDIFERHPQDPERHIMMVNRRKHNS